jgi:triacylglycerol lipase
MLACYMNVVLWILVFVIITIIIFYVLITFTIINLPETVVTTLSEKFDHPCTLDFPLSYREPVYIPKQNGVYEKKLAVALIDVCYIASSGNCNDFLPIPNPPGFTNQLRIEGQVPTSSQSLLLAYIFWNEQTGRVIYSFVGTETKPLWECDIMYWQTNPNELNGSTSDMLVHQGFYSVYLAARTQLWDWYNANKSWVKYLFTVGHSLGSSLASLAAFDFADTPTEIISYTYGGPRVGNVAFAQGFQNRVPTALRIFNSEDIIVDIILAQLFQWTYCSLGQNVPFTKSGGSLAYNHLKSYYFDLPGNPVCAH